MVDGGRDMMTTTTAAVAAAAATTAAAAATAGAAAPTMMTIQRGNGGMHNALEKYRQLFEKTKYVRVVH